jgi:hypothetical protein
MLEVGTKAVFSSPRETEPAETLYIVDLDSMNAERRLQGRPPRTITTCYMGRAETKSLYAGVYKLVQKGTGA